MKLSDVLDGFFRLCLYGGLDIEITGISDDSRTIQKGSVFVCIRGAKTDGFDKIEEAIDKGAIAVVADRPCALSHRYPVTWIQTPDTRLAAAKMAAAFYGYPSAKMTMIGITGTKGKTTTACMLKSVCEAAGRRVGIIGTVEVDDGKTVSRAFNTTPGPIILQRHLYDMAEHGVDTVVMEVSSQGLKQSRTAGIMFDAAIWTNMSPDHIGENEHADMDEYICCKRMIFNQCRMCIVNGDDAVVMAQAAQAQCRLKYFGYTTHARYAPFLYTGVINAQKQLICTTPSGVTMTIDTVMPGNFNRTNALAAAAAADSLGIEAKFIQEGISKTRVPGRTEIIEGPWTATVMIDYAHNAAALESLLTNLRKDCRGRLICMFGCGGNRDRCRRSAMGRISGRLADLTVITTDNPRYENPLAIMNDIAEGVRQTGGRYKMIERRDAAIDYCLGQGMAGDLVILAGKGHESYQEIQGIRYPFDEKQYLLNKRL